ncbi:NADH:ubiquinone oxidoreductase [Mycoemilia scoparia]|uniref:NADH:ubiquinone reductase (non-electrogenic) n=1 Tax=Mycoemilia scoparia TaxID=417184 RepID=A0A9W8DWM6_9FUNG|nr:NADH:ubiquinone oxidoreductase [Mycoemilia scoparia]
MRGAASNRQNILRIISAGIYRTAKVGSSHSTSVFRSMSTTAGAKGYSRSRLWSGIKYGTLFTVATATSYIGWKIYDAKYPINQKPYDPNLKTLVILGTGWGAATVLKNVDTDKYNVVVVSPRNYFLFTPLLPSCTVGTIENRSIMEPIRHITRHKSRDVTVYEANCTDVNPQTNEITIQGFTDVQAERPKTVLKYDYLVMAVGAMNNTFNTPGVEKYACFLKEIWDAKKIRQKLMDCIETAAYKGQTPKERKRLLHMVVVGGGPTGVEYAGELYDFMTDDLRYWYPELVEDVKITLVEALPNVLPMFDKKLIEYTQNTFKENSINILTKTMVKEVKETTITVQDENKNLVEIPYGLIVWATGNKARAVTEKLRSKISKDDQSSPRGLVVDDYLRVKGVKNIWALGDCSVSKYAPLAQVAERQGKWLAKALNGIADSDSGYEDVEKETPFQYTSYGSLAYIGSDKAIAELPIFNRSLKSGGAATYLFWRSAYLSELFSIRSTAFVMYDWAKKTMFGRDISRE